MASAMYAQETEQPGAAPGVVIDGPPAPMPPQVVSRDARGGATVRAVRLPQPLALDGRLDEAVYRNVLPITGLVQIAPDEGAPASEATEAWILFDDTAVYLAARCFDSAPESEWIANELRRDTTQLRVNDTFGVMFDTFYDRRSGVVFYTNPLGAIADFEFSNEGAPNADWNPIWDVRTGRFDGGWTVEMQIPFKSLRYRPGTDQVWGVQLRRVIRRKNEGAYLTALPISVIGNGNVTSAVSRASLAGTLVGLVAPPGSRNLEVKPYGIAGVTTDLGANPAIANEADGDVGVDVKYRVTQNLTADFTYNTDFAQVEVDEQQVNLTRFSLFFPEKREFFLEGRGNFDFGGGAGFGPSNVPRLFFSRRIGLERGQPVPIDGGGRLNGKIGAFSLGVLNIQTDALASAGALPTNFTVLRLKRDVLRRSSIGGIFTNRSVSTLGDGSNQAYGLDARLAFYDNVNVSTYIARTETPGLDGDDLSYQANFNYNGDRYGVQADHLFVGDHFNPEVGFLRRDDFRRSFGSVRFSPRPASLDLVRQFTWQASIDYILNGANMLETRELRAGFATEFENSDRLTLDLYDTYDFLEAPFTIAGVTIPVGGYDFRDGRVSYTLGPQRRMSGQLSLQHGGFFGGERTSVGYSQGRVEITQLFSVEPSVSLDRVDLPAGAFTTTLTRVRMTYTFTPRMFFSGLLQYNSSRDALSTNLRLRWEYQPGSELFVVYTDERDTEMSRGFPQLENRALVVKLNRLFRF